MYAIRSYYGFIESNYSQKITIQDIAAFVGLDRTYLSSLFKAKYGSSLQSFLVEYRMKRATELLASPELSISDISRSVGYTDPFIFSKMFKNRITSYNVCYTKLLRLRRMEVTDTPGGDGEGIYFGPYTASKHSVQRAIQSIEECYHIACSQPLAERACLNYSLGLCLGVCLGGSAVQEYERIMDRIVSLLQGSGSALLVITSYSIHYTKLYECA